MNRSDGCSIVRIPWIRVFAWTAFFLLLQGNLQAQPNLNVKRVTVNWPTIELYFSVGCNGTPAYNMTRQDFRVFEVGVEVTDFTLWCPDPTVRCAMSVSLVFDASNSMIGPGNAGAKQAGHAFVDLMDGVADEAAVVFFNHEVTKYQAMTTVKPMLHAAVDSLPSSGGTAVWDGIYTGVMELINNGVNQCRTVIAMTDGRDNASTHTVPEIISLANRHRIRVFTIGLGMDIDAVELEQIALFTGGRYYLTPNAGQLAAIYQEISTIVFRSFQECLITYERDCADGGMRTTELQLRNFCGGTDVKTKTYRAPLDSTTFQPQAVKLDRVQSAVPGIATVPLSFPGFPQNSLVPPFRFSLEYDTSKISYYGIQSHPSSTLNPSLISIVPTPNGLEFQSIDRTQFKSDTMCLLQFLTKEPLAQIPCPLEITDFQFESGCHDARIESGLISSLGTNLPSLAIHPSGSIALNVFENDSVDCVLALLNLGSASLRLDGLETMFHTGDSADWDILSALPDSIASQQMHLVHLRYHARGGDVSRLSLLVNSNDPVYPQMRTEFTTYVNRWSEYRLRVSPMFVDFGVQRPGSSISATVRLRNEGLFTAEIFDEKMTGLHPGAFSLTTPLPRGIAAGVSVDVPIVFHESMDGTYFGEYRVSNGAGSDLIVYLTGSISDGEPILHLEPDDGIVDFGTVALNQTKTERITVRNDGTADLELDGFGISGRDGDLFTVLYRPARIIPPNGTDSVTIEFSSLRVGNALASLDFSTNDPNRNSITVALLANATTTAVGPTAAAIDGVTIGPPFPHPATNTSVLPIFSASSQAVRIGVFDLLGRNVHPLTRHDLLPGRNLLAIPDFGLPQGQYLLSVETASGATQWCRILLR